MCVRLKRRTFEGACELSVGPGLGGGGDGDEVKRTRSEQEEEGGGGGDPQPRMNRIKKRAKVRFGGGGKVVAGSKVSTDTLCLSISSFHSCTFRSIYSRLHYSARSLLLAFSFCRIFWKRKRKHSQDGGAFMPNK